jgi:hypothetical protein
MVCKIAKREISIFVEGPQILKKNCKVADLSVAELISGPPTFGIIVKMNTAFYVTPVHIGL